MATPQKRSRVYDIRWAAAGFVGLLAAVAVVFHFLGFDVTFGLRRQLAGPDIEVVDRPLALGDGRMTRSLFLDHVLFGLQFQREPPGPATYGEERLTERTATTYYHRKGPIGMVFARTASGLDVDSG